MYVNAKMDSCMANDIKNKAKNAYVVFEERKMQNKYNTPWAIKRSQLVFVCNFVKNQRILMQFSLLDFKMNDTCGAMNFTHLT